MLLLALLLPGCTLPRDEGRHFAARLAAARGQPVQPFIDELGVENVTEEEGRRTWTWHVLWYPRGGECKIEVTADPAGLITGSRIEGSDYTCGELVVDARKEAERHRRDPGLKARQEEEGRRLLEELVKARRILSEDKKD